MYDTGRGTRQDYLVALEWYRRAADRGSFDAMFAVGNLYASGFGVGKDLQEAKKWYCAAASLGHTNALEVLGGEDIEAVCGSLDPLRQPSGETRLPVED